MIQPQYQQSKNHIELQVQFLADVEFGNPRTKDCRNYGICRIHALGKVNYNNKKSCQKCATIAKITVFNRHHVAMDFLPNNIHAHIYKKYFSTNTFTVDQDYTYTSENSVHNFKIAKGSYPIRKEKRQLKVIFKVNTVVEHNSSDT